jgi:hypothetical protein
MYTVYIYITIKTNAMTTIAELKASKISKVVDNFTAVIVKSYYSARKFNYGIQYWKEEWIKEGVRFNTDGSKSHLVELF